MYVIQARNVNDAYRQGMQLISAQGIRQPSRAGEVLVLDRPVTTVYERPMERVLFDPKRDANPIFHLMEAIWMLAGWRDATWLDMFVGDFSKRFAEENGEAHGAYGYRWRDHFLRAGQKETKEDLERMGANPIPGEIPLPTKIDQIVECGQILLKDPTSRQSVMAMWDPAIDLGAKKRDIPCNDLVMFRGRYDHIDQLWVLDTTVLCRSNDIIWGAYGANAVHMSFMAEVVAAIAGMRLGRYYQVSNNYHAYLDIFNKMYPPFYEVTSYDQYRLGLAMPIPLFDDYRARYQGDNRGKTSEKGLAFLAACEAFMEDRVISSNGPIFFDDVVYPLLRAYRDHWKKGDKVGALDIVRHMKPSDWQLATLQWMGRRLVKIEGSGQSVDVRDK